MESGSSGTSGEARRNPWSGPSASVIPRVARPVEAPDTGVVLKVHVSPEDAVAAACLWGRLMQPAGGLGGALCGGLMAIAALTLVRSATAGQWKQVQPTGTALAAAIGLVVVFAALGWLLEARLMPLLRHRLSRGQARRVLRPPGEDFGAITVTLGERALHWQGERATQRYDVSLLRGLTEDADYMLLRVGFGCFATLPKRDLDAAQEAAVRDWVARHGREGLA